MTSGGCLLGAYAPSFMIPPPTGAEKMRPGPDENSNIKTGASVYEIRLRVPPAYLRRKSTPSFDSPSVRVKRRFVPWGPSRALSQNGATWMKCSPGRMNFSS